MHQCPGYLTKQKKKRYRQYRCFSLQLAPLLCSLYLLQTRIWGAVAAALLVPGGHRVAGKGSLCLSQNGVTLIWGRIGKVFKRGGNSRAVFPSASPNQHPLEPETLREGSGNSVPQFSWYKHNTCTWP